MNDMITFLTLDAANFEAAQIAHTEELAALAACFEAANSAELAAIETEELAALAELARVEAARVEAARVEAQAAQIDFAAQILKTLQARNAEQHSKDTDIAINIVCKSAKQINLVFNKPEFSEIFSRLLRNMRIADAAQNRIDFVAVKVLVKIFNVLSAIASGQLNSVDNHTKIIGFQLVKLSSLTNKSAMVAQSKSIKYDALDNVQALDYKHTSNYTIGTTGTQTSSTRMLFNYLGMCDVNKGKQGDVITIQDNQRCKSFINLFEKNKHEEKTA